jgi:hypothetical protein
MKTFTLAAGLVGLIGGVAHGQTLYGVGNFSNFGSQSLYQIDSQSGVATLVGSTGLRQIAGLDWDSASNRLVALTVGGDIFEIDRSTGASTRVVDLAFGVPEGSLLSRNGVNMTTLSNDLSMLDGSSWRSIGTSGLSATADISGLEIVDGGRLLGLATNASADDSLVSFDLATGLATTLGVTGTNSGSLGGLAYLDALYMTDGASLYRVDTQSGSASLIGSHGVSGFSGLAIPAPGTAVMLGLAALATGRRRR